MEFGLFSNNRRPDRVIGDAWNEDIYEAEVADRLGINEIWFSEHQSPAELIICKAAGRTEQIRLGSAVRPLGYYHPLQVALEANTTDQLTGGRYMLGIGTGFYPRKLAWRGQDPDAMRAVVEPSIKLMRGPAPSRSITTARSGRASRWCWRSRRCRNRIRRSPSPPPTRSDRWSSPAGSASWC
jgi:alkanesulfonate monooxygenase SsuD/methylene tetrahydromethanopterin reductase-like flavin-dependent oxidoreductase (luciferase family)